MRPGPERLGIFLFNSRITREARSAEAYARGGVPPRTRPPVRPRVRYDRGVRDSALTDTELRTLNAASVPR
jgi:hypothetical protein